MPNLFIFVFLFPALMHIYWGVFDILYMNQILYVLIPLLISSLLFPSSNSVSVLKIDKKLSLYIFLLLISIALASIMNHSYNDAIKYLAYFFVFYFIFNRLITKRTYYHYFVNTVVFFSALSLFVYLLYLAGAVNPYLYVVDDLTLLTNDSSFMTRKDWNYSIPFYISVIPLNGLADENINIFGLERFFGLSTEPTLFSVVVLIGLVLSINLKKYVSSMILLLVLLFSSSYGALTILCVGLIYYYFYEYKMIITVGLLLPAIAALWILLGFDIQRVVDYSILLNNAFSIQYQFFGQAAFSEDQKTFSGVLELAKNFGLVTLFLYLLLVIYVFQQIMVYGNRQLFLVFFVSFLILSKASEPISLLFLFVINFILLEIRGLRFK